MPSCCDKCDKSFKSRRSLGQHKRRHHQLQQEEEEEEGKSKRRRHSCDQCGFESHRASIVEEHTLAQHYGLPQYTCQPCGRKFAHSNTREQHYLKCLLNQKPKKRSRRAVCVQCGKDFAGQDGLEGHLNREHREGRPRPYKCEKCAEAFYNLSALYKHTKRHH